MILHSTKVATADMRGRCFTCKGPIEDGQRVRWCEVEGFMPPGWIHAIHFDAGPLIDRGRLGSHRTFRRSGTGRRCGHAWLPWVRSGIFDATERRTCQKCNRIQTRKSRLS
jgi:hypothetical protein